MIISFWRYSHLCLAVFSFLLLTLAAASGIVLAFEPVIQKSNPYKAAGFDTITLAQSIPVIKKKLHGIQELSIDDNSFVIAKFTDGDGKNRTTYIHPLTGEILGTVQKQNAVFAWMTDFHRSLFMHETGRLIVGITTFLLILIALSGIALIIQRQKSIKRFFAPIEKTGFAQYYHTVFGRLSLLFILAVALSGAYLFASRFIIRPQKVNITVNENDIKEGPEKALQDFTVFQQTRLADAEAVQFPFSEFPEDYYTLKLKNGEVCVNQVTGDILAKQPYPGSYTLTKFSLQWHTGRSGTIWAIILAITSAYILFFIYSGLFIAWKRISSKSKNKFSPDECSIIILVGSENGSTYTFASAIYKQLLKQGKKAYLADLDTYTVYPKAKYIIVMTGTYGEGDPPSNAKKFISRLPKYPQLHTVQFSVVGFGSRSYQHFCKFAYAVDDLLNKQPWAVRMTDAVTVNEKSPQDFSTWLTAFKQYTGLPLTLSRKLLSPQLQGLEKITITGKTSPDENNTFLIRMKTKRFKKAASGDLLAVYPKNDHRERLYSIGRVDDEIQLSVKLHDHGLGSNYLNTLQSGENIKVRIIRNQHFHFPKHASKLIMISNGTGIAPFLGMITENRKKIPCYLYCGFRTQSSFKLYETFLKKNISMGNLTQYNPALSREGEKEYISHLLQKDKQFIDDALKTGSVIMICGSLSMQKNILAVLENICNNNKLETLEAYKDKGQVLTDCY